LRRWCSRLVFEAGVCGVGVSGVDFWAWTFGRGLSLFRTWSALHAVPRMECRAHGVPRMHCCAWRSRMPCRAAACCLHHHRHLRSQTTCAHTTVIAAPSRQAPTPASNQASTLHHTQSQPVTTLTEASIRHSLYDKTHTKRCSTTRCTALDHSGPLLTYHCIYSSQHIASAHHRDSHRRFRSKSTRAAKKLRHLVYLRKSSDLGHKVSDRPPSNLNFFPEPRSL
jgi:hypothetical protein